MPHYSGGSRVLQKGGGAAALRSSPAIGAALVRVGGKDAAKAHTQPAQTLHESSRRRPGPITPGLSAVANASKRALDTPGKIMDARGSGFRPSPGRLEKQCR